MLSSKEALAMTKAAATVNELPPRLARTRRNPQVAQFATNFANNFVAVPPPLVAPHSSSHL